MYSASEFWKWFKTNNSNFFFLNQIENEDERERLLDLFSEHLHKYSNKLYFLIGGHPDETQDLIITAEGDVSAFDKVEELVSQAPKLNNWNIIAFKPPADSIVTSEANGISLNPKNLWFIPLENSKRPDQLGIRIFSSDYTPERRRDFLFVVHQILDSLLGERSYALNVHYIDIAELPDNYLNKDFIKLLDLPQYIERRTSTNRSIN